MVGKNATSGSKARRDYAKYLEEKAVLEAEKEQEKALKKSKKVKAKKTKKSVADKAKNLWNND